MYKRQELLKEAGYDKGLKLKLWINDNPIRRDIAVIAQDQLKPVSYTHLDVYKRQTYRRNIRH